MTRIRGRDRYRPRALHRARREASCADLTEFVHGELHPTRAAAFRVHLRACETCRRALRTDVVLNARLSEREGSSR